MMDKRDKGVFKPYREDLAAAIDASLKVLAYCRANDWAGYDPYDALNSRVFTVLPFLNVRLPRLALTQAMKRCPFNLRPLLLVPKTQNPKGLALFLTALLKLVKLGLLDQEKELVGIMAEKLGDLRSSNAPYWCWGYSFPWQTRTLLVPRGAPNLVCTSFVANALLELYEASHEARYLNMAVSAAEYILNELYWTEGNSVACFSYPAPSSRSQVHNANFLGAALLCRVYNHSDERKFLEPALKVARYSAGKQRADGSWDYGESPTQRWIDNFHTGYNLCALHRIGQEAETAEFNTHISRGFEFYRGHFFREDGAPKYFHDRTYPLDVHSAAQSILTLLELKDLDKANVTLAHSVFKWAGANLWNEGGFFYHQKLRYGTIKIPYMRWGQAWMLLALATILEDARGTQSAQACCQIHRLQEAVK
jgi:rhamnogalacturonyl hydrolase YesR